MCSNLEYTHIGYDTTQYGYAFKSFTRTALRRRHRRRAVHQRPAAGAGAALRQRRPELLRKGDHSPRGVGIGSRTARTRELAKLTSAGLVTLRRVGNQTHYQANPASPVYEELRTLILKSSGLVDVLRSALAPRAAEISLAFVFGSVAKRVDSASSDIDVLIVSDTLSYAELFALLETATQRLGRPVNPTLHSRDDLTARITKKNSFITKVLAQGKLWIIGSERDVATQSPAAGSRPKL